MNSDEEKYIDALIAGKRPPPAAVDEDGADMLRTAITLQGARADLAEPRETFVDGLFEELSASHGSHPVASPRRARRPRRAMLASAAAAVALVAGTFGVTEAVAHRAPAVAALPEGRVQTSVLFDSQHRPHGTVNLYAGNPSWVFMTLDDPGQTGAVICQLRGRDGRVLVTGRFDVTSGAGEWARTIDVSPAAVASARIETSTGATLAVAQLGAS